jgi:response regulator RpfG family c-di-GMP phosphodiesterase
MRELRYAGLLHDFGKVGVREEVLVKAKKLPSAMLERIQARFQLLRQRLETDLLRRKCAYLMDRGKEGIEALVKGLEEEVRCEMERLERYEKAVLEANEPRMLPEDSAGILLEIAGATFRSPGGPEVPYLDPEELHFLSITKGSLDPDERRQIEAHVTHTYNFLRQIPWTDDLAHVVDIAFGHHETLDGRGYPRGIGGDDLPLQTRIMTVSDIFDALTASDRPYKKALSAARALDILQAEASESKLDTAVVEALVESRVYERILREDWREL